MDGYLIKGYWAFDSHASVLDLAGLICLPEGFRSTCVKDFLFRACLSVRIAIICVSPKPARACIDDHLQRLPLRAIVNQSCEDGLSKGHFCIKMSSLLYLRKNASFFHLTRYLWDSPHSQSHINHLCACHIYENCCKHLCHFNIY